MKKSLIVDGYNVIHQTPQYSMLAEEGLDLARAALVSDVSSLAASEGWKATVVFDGHANPRSNGVTHRLVNVRVIFSKFGVEADAVVESLAKASRERGDETVVVTSDAQLQWAVLGGSVGRMSSAEFADAVRTRVDWWREHSPAGSTKGRIEDRIDEQTRRKLSEWARA